MTNEHKNLHARVLNFRERYRKMEIEFIHMIQDIERTRLHRAFGCSSVFKYAVDVITFSESMAYTYISVARTALEFPELMKSGLSVSKASRIVSTLTKENATKLIQFALTHTSKQIDRQVARINPRGGRERVKPLADEFFEINLAASAQFLEKLERVESLQAQRGLKAGPGAAIEAALDEYLRRHDPVAKAERAMKRKAKAEPKASPKAPELCLNRVRKPLTAEQKHTVFYRDKGRCTQTDAMGKRCGSDRWVDIHHVQEGRCSEDRTSPRI